MSLSLPYSFGSLLFSDASQEIFGPLRSQARLFAFSCVSHTLIRAFDHSILRLCACFHHEDSCFVPSHTGPLVSHFVPRRVFELFQASDCLLWHSDSVFNVFCDLEHSSHNRL